LEIGSAVFTTKVKTSAILAAEFFMHSLVGNEIPAAGKTLFVCIRIHYPYYDKDEKLVNKADIL